MEIKTDWRPVWWSLAWSWLLMFIPSILMAIEAYGVRYSISDGALHASQGMMTKRHVVVELYRVKTIEASENVFSGGRVFITNQDGSSHVFKYVANPAAVVSMIRQAVSGDRDNKNFKYRETF